MAQRILLALALGVVHVMVLHAQWVPGNGPYGGRVSSLLVSGADIFAGDGSGIYRSADSGFHWSPASSGLASFAVRALAARGPSLFAGTAGGIYRSTNNGGTWSAVNTGLDSLNVSSLAVSGSSIFAGTFNGGVYRSTNDGGNWSPVNSGLTDINVLTLYVRGGDIFAGTYGAGLFRSTNDGGSWRQILADHRVYAVAAIGTHLFAGTTPDTLMHSSDDGATWTRTASGINNDQPLSMTVKENTIFLGTAGGVFRSSNYTGWTKLFNLMSFTNCYALAVSGGSLLAGTDYGFSRSTDNATNWTRYNEGMLDHRVSSLASDGTNIFSGTEYVLVDYSTDRGQSWQTASTRLYNGEEFTIGSIAINGNYIYVGTMGGGIRRSTSDGTGWTSGNNGLTTDNITALAVSGTNVFAGTDTRGVFIAGYSGDNWVPVEPDTLQDSYPLVSGLVVSGPDLFSATHKGVFRLYNAGATWKQTGAGLKDTVVTAIGTDAGYLYAGTHYGNLLRSSDNGANWTLAASGLSDSSIVALAFDKGRIYAATEGDGVFRSLDRGATWTAVNLGLASRQVHAVAVNGLNLFAATDRGMWRRALSQLSDIGTVDTADAASRTPEADLPTEGAIALYPNPLSSRGTLHYRLAGRSPAELTITDALGRAVAPPIEIPAEEEGEHQVEISVADLAPGLYFCRLHAEGYDAVVRLNVVR
jgi:ligand-binding sensor domain-containing protein